MREILFRGKTKKGDWAYGYVQINSNEMALIYPIDDFIGIKVIPETVGQYTGLTDKNGKKIFESDIVKAIQTEYDEDKEKEPIVFEFIGEMIFEDGCFGLRTKHIVDFYAPMWEEEDVKLEVIGNLFDNPELLEVKE